MRDIARNAEIPTGLIYSYFKNKENLFEAIVEPTYNSIKMLLMEVERPKNHSDYFFKEEMEFLVKILSTQRKQFIILVDKSSGTKYVDALKDIVDLAHSHIKKHSGEKLNIIKPYIEDDFFHILANSFVQSIVEIARHYKGDEWARNIIRLLGKQFFYGVNGI